VLPWYVTSGGARRFALFLAGEYGTDQEGIVKQKRKEREKKKKKHKKDNNQKGKKTQTATTPARTYKQRLEKAFA